MKLAITGVGIVSPLGNTLSENINNLKAMQVPIQDYRPQGHFSDWILNVKKAFHCNYEDVDLTDLIKARLISALVASSFTSNSSSFDKSFDDNPK